MGRLGGASQRALFYFSNFLEFLVGKISEIKTTFFNFGYIERSFRTTFLKISKSNQNLKLSSYFWKMCILKTESIFDKPVFSQINPYKLRPDIIKLNINNIFVPVYLFHLIRQ